jgi:hypothetical protein
VPTWHEGDKAPNQAISEKLVVTPRAVEKHVTGIFTKLSLPPSTEDHRRVLAAIT